MNYRAELARCRREQDICRRDLHIDSGALIGLADWTMEERLIRREMNQPKHTPGPWHWVNDNTDKPIDLSNVTFLIGSLRTIAESKDQFGTTLPEWILSYVEADIGTKGTGAANARILAASVTMYDEMCRYRIILARLAARPDLWDQFTSGTGIATMNAYDAAIKQAEEGPQ